MLTSLLKIDGEEIVKVILIVVVGFFLVIISIDLIIHGRQESNRVHLVIVTGSNVLLYILSKHIWSLARGLIFSQGFDLYPEV